MKRIPITGWLGAALLAFALVLGAVAPAVEATPTAPADIVTESRSRDICTYRRNSVGLQSYWISARTIHYGTAHVTQCWFMSGAPWGWGVYSYCDQYVWGPGVANPYWDRYKQGFYPVACW